MTAIFISYRRDDSEGHAGRLFDDLRKRFGAGSVFMDVSSIALGSDFRQAIDDSVGACNLLLALVGTRWLDTRTSAGARRLDDPADFVRLEIAAALKRRIPVVPVLVQGAKMPAADALPPDMRDLAFRNGMELRHASWASDVAVLMDALQMHIPLPAAAAAQGGGSVGQAGALRSPVPSPGASPGSSPFTQADGPAAAPPPPPSSGPPSAAPTARTAPDPGPAVSTASAAAPPRRGGLLTIGVVLLAAPALAVWWSQSAPTATPPASPPSAAPAVDLALVQSLVADMNSADEAARKAATTRLIREFGSSPAAIGLVVDQLSDANQNALRPEGRINVLTFLLESPRSAWNTLHQSDTIEAVKRIQQNIDERRTHVDTQYAALLRKLLASFDGQPIGPVLLPPSRPPG